MPKLTQIERVIANLEAERAVLDVAILKLKAQLGPKSTKRTRPIAIDRAKAAEQSA